MGEATVHYTVHFFEHPAFPSPPPAPQLHGQINIVKERLWIEIQKQVAEVVIV